MFAVATAKVEFENIFGISRCLERVLHCTPVEAGDYTIGHAYLGLDLSVGQDDGISLKLWSIKELNNPNHSIVGKLKFGGSELSFSTLNRGNESLSVVPKMGQSAIEIGPDKAGVTLSLVRYQNQAQAPIPISQQIAHIFTKPV